MALGKIQITLRHSKKVSPSGLDSVVKFHFIQTATAICYWGEEMEESIDNKSDNKVRM